MAPYLEIWLTPENESFIRIYWRDKYGVNFGRKHFGYAIKQSDASVKIALRKFMQLVQQILIKCDFRGCLITSVNATT